MNSVNQGYLYQPYFCEENIWQLAKQRNEADAEVWFIISPNNTVATAMQKSAEQGACIIWDYHVVYYSPHEGVMDFDTCCPFPCEPSQYLELSFNNIQKQVTAEYKPYFRVIPAIDYLKQFSSNRSHMLNDKGKYRQLPPKWPCIGDGNTFSAFIRFDDKAYGNIYSLDDLLLRFPFFG